VVSFYAQKLIPSAPFFLSEFGKPNVQVLIIPDKRDSHKVSFEITNPDGKTAATHLKLLIRSPENIIHYSNLSSENMSISQIGPKLLAANMPRLVQGNGAFAIVNLTIDTKPNTNYFSSYRAYLHMIKEVILDR
jgi:hypothetical protein